MAHHSGANPEDPNDPFFNLLPELKLGATGKFPQGKLREDDEGEIRIAIGHQDGKVIMNFGKQTVWIGFDSRQARQVAASLIEHAEFIESNLSKPS